ncbi:carbonic anhydrase family protein [Undibacterium sp. Di26W]|uniref:carbonic anhydrase family protein n=1 Tax=Undibacterium sp. Di26W TaxID=3413035 RepID=UPI003BF20A21
MPTSVVAENYQKQCRNWKYPELLGTTNNWVATDCLKCADSIPNQSPIVLDPTTANSGSGWTVPTNLSDPRFAVNLVRKDDHNNYAFAVNPQGGRPLTIVSSNWGGAGTMTFTLQEFHFHVPAEHAIVRQPISMLEMHVKASGVGSGAINNRKVDAVFAVQFAIGPETGGPYSVLQPVAESMAGNPTLPIKHFQLGSLIFPFTTQPQFQYYGSLTTPTCDTPVFFFVLREPVRIHSADWNSIANSLTLLNGVSNARPLQARPLTTPSSVAIVSP